jgi:hypothetical protein
VSVVTNAEGVQIEKDEGRGSERSVILVGLTEDGFDDAAVDAQIAAQPGGPSQDGASALTDERVVGRGRSFEQGVLEEQSAFESAQRGKGDV